VAWRETVKKSLGSTRYLVRLLVLLELPLLPLVSMMLFDLIEGRQLVLPRPAGMVYPVWFFAVLFVSVHATGAIANERSHQTLDVLLSTPLSSGEIVSQKLAGVWKLCFVLAIPFATAVLYELMTTAEAHVAYIPTAVNTWTGEGYSQPVYRRWLHLFWSIASFLVYLPLMAWLGLWLSLRLASRLRALVTQILLTVAVCAIPLLFISPYRGVMTGPALVAAVVSPLQALMQIEMHRVPFDDVMTMVTIALNLAIWAGVACWLRFRCYRHFAELTGRLDPLRPSRVVSAVEKPALGFEAAGGTG
jgi:ABC-type Na+ efflux pump permease subunit